MSYMTNAPVGADWSDPSVTAMVVTVEGPDGGGITLVASGENRIMEDDEVRKLVEARPEEHGVPQYAPGGKLLTNIPLKHMSDEQRARFDKEVGELRKRKPKERADA